MYKFCNTVFWVKNCYHQMFCQHHSAYQFGESFLETKSFYLKLLYPSGRSNKLIIWKQRSITSRKWYHQWSSFFTFRSTISTAAIYNSGTHYHKHCTRHFYTFSTLIQINFNNTVVGQSVNNWVKWFLGRLLMFLIMSYRWK